MVLNEDCVRDILLYLEKTLNYNSYGIMGTNSIIIEDELKKYDNKIVHYAIEKLIEGEIISTHGIPHNMIDRLPSIQISDITYRGHELLNNIRPESAWQKTKSVACKMGRHSLGFLETVAHDIAIEAAKEAVKIAMTSVS